VSDKNKPQIKLVPPTTDEKPADPQAATDAELNTVDAQKTAQKAFRSWLRFKSKENLALLRKAMQAAVEEERAALTADL
jgi:hypothetical protein